MANNEFDILSTGDNASETHDANTHGQIFQANTNAIELPDNSFIRDADIQRDGGDLVLDGPSGTITIEGYFDALEAPALHTPDGSVLTPELVNSFVKSPSVYAQSMSMNDESPIGAVDEMSGDATVTRTDGSVHKISLGTEIYQGDIVETSSDGAVNIVFSDESSFAVSEDARLAIDEYVYDPTTEEGAQNFSVLKGVFVFTSGLVGRDDPDDVSIETPSGSIGIRGTIIAGDVNEGEITVVEGAIVLRDHSGNEMTLASQYETAKFGNNGEGISNQGRLSPNDMNSKFGSVSKVAPSLFSSINDTAAEGVDAVANENQVQDGEDTSAESQNENGEEAKPDADGTVDQDGDNQVDGSVEDGETAESSNDQTGEGEMQMNKAGTIDGETAIPPAPKMNMMGDKMGSHMDSANQNGELGEAIMQKMTGDKKSAPARNDTQPDGDRANSTDGENTDSTTFDTTRPPIVPEDGDNTAGTTTPPEIDILSLNENGEGAFMANQDGVMYLGGSDNDIFTNVNESTGIHHQDIGVKTDGANDHILLQSGLGTPDTGNLRLTKILTGGGDDTIKLDFSYGLNDVHIGELNGGNGNDTLQITGDTGSGLNFADINIFHGIEFINLADGDDGQVLDLNSINFKEGLKTSNYLHDDGTEVRKTVKISGDEFGSDTIKLDTGAGSGWNYMGLDGGYEQYDTTIDGVDVRLLVDADVAII